MVRVLKIEAINAPADPKVASRPLEIPENQAISLSSSGFGTVGRPFFEMPGHLLPRSKKTPTIG